MSNSQIHHLPDGVYPNCELLVTCCNANGALYKLSFDGSKAVVHTLIRADFRGIAKWGANYVTVSQNMIHLLGSEFQLLKFQEVHDADLHGVAVYNEKAYIVETGNNVIGIYKLPSLKKTGEITFGNHGEDFNHVNDLFITQNDIYLSMFSGKTQWRKDFGHSGIIVKYSFERNKVDKLVTKLNQPHSVLVNGENLYYCSSLDLEVNENHDTIFRNFGYLRGLALHDGMMFIGQSKSRDHMKIVIQDYYNLSYDCGIYIFDMSEKISRFIHLPSSEVYGILVM